MAVKNVVLRGFGNGGVLGSIKGIVLRGFGAINDNSGAGGAGKLVGRFKKAQIKGRMY